jgi:ATP-dependent helicase/nuclease subunit A
MPLLSRFGAQPATVDDAGRHYREAARRALDHLEDGDAGDAGTPPPSAPPWPGWTTTRRLIGLLVAMLARREQWRAIAALDDPESAIGAALERNAGEEMRRRGADAGRRPGRRQWMPLARFAAANLGGAHASHCSPTGPRRCPPEVASCRAGARWPPSC